jgi:hypothetical protein
VGLSKSCGGYSQWYIVYRRFLSPASEEALYGIIIFDAGLLNNATASLYGVHEEPLFSDVSPSSVGERYTSHGEPLLAAFTDRNRVRLF